MNEPSLNSLLIGAVAGGIAVVVVFAIAKAKGLRFKTGSKMGVNLASDQRCPKCGTPFPAIRIPTSYRQAMWGGWSCKKCGGEFDKWLVPVPKAK